MFVEIIFGRIGILMQPVAVGGFYNDVVGLRKGLGRAEYGFAVSAYVSAVSDACDFVVFL